LIEWLRAEGAAAHAGELAGLRPNGGPGLGLAQFWAWESKGAMGIAMAGFWRRGEAAKGMLGGETARRTDDERLRARGCEREREKGPASTLTTMRSSGGSCRC